MARRRNKAFHIHGRPYFLHLDPAKAPEAKSAQATDANGAEAKEAAAESADVEAKRAAGLSTGVVRHVQARIEGEVTLQEITD